MSKQASTVFYDQQTNNYYKIDKNTGKVQQSFKTGKVPAKFNPDVTGKSYVKRKLHLKSQSHRILSEYRAQLIPSIKTSKNQSRMTPVKFDHDFSTIQHDISEQNKQKYQNSTINYDRGKSHRLTDGSNLADSRSFQGKHYFRFSKQSNITQNVKYLFQKSGRLIDHSNSFRESSLDDSKQEFSNSRLMQQNLNDLILKYNHFQTLKASQNNHSNSKYVSGTLPVLNVQMQAGRKSGFDILPSRLQIKKKTLKKLKQSELRSSLTQDPIQNAKCVHKQLSKQKRIFYQFHPELIFKQNQRLINQQIDRKINFKKLQKLALAQNNKVCGQIYKSTIEE